MHTNMGVEKQVAAGDSGRHLSRDYPGDYRAPGGAFRLSDRMDWHLGRFVSSNVEDGDTSNHSVQSSCR